MRIFEKNSALLLLEHLTSIQSDHHGFRAIIFNLSKLKKENKSNFQIKIVTNILSDLVGNMKSDLFICHDFDLILIFKNEDLELTNQIIHQIRYLFQTDPLAYMKDKRENPNFAFAYNLIFQWRDFFIFCKKKAESEKFPQISSEEFTSLNLIEIESGLDQLETERITRIRPTYLVPKSAPMKLILNEIHVSPENVAKILLSDESHKTQFENPIITNKINNKILTMLQLKARHYKAGTLLLKLSTNNILSPEFHNFHNMMLEQEKISLVVEMDISEFFSNFTSFLEAKSLLKKMGYKTCLGGLNFSNFFSINRENLGFDLMKITWNDQFLESDFDIEELQNAISRNVPNRIILANCQNSDILDLAISMNISVFQGSHVSKIFKSTQIDESI